MGMERRTRLKTAIAASDSVSLHAALKDANEGYVEETMIAGGEALLRELVAENLNVAIAAACMRLRGSAIDGMRESKITAQTRAAHALLRVALGEAKTERDWAEAASPDLDFRPSIAELAQLISHGEKRLLELADKVKEDERRSDEEEEKLTREAFQPSQPSQEALQESSDDDADGSAGKSGGITSRLLQELCAFFRSQDNGGRNGYRMAKADKVNEHIEACSEPDLLRELLGRVAKFRDAKVYVFDESRVEAAAEWAAAKDKSRPTDDDSDPAAAAGSGVVAGSGAVAAGGAAVGARTAASGGAPRRSYKCGKCGMLKKGHACPGANSGSKLPARPALGARKKQKKLPRTQVYPHTHTQTLETGMHSRTRRRRRSARRRRRRRRRGNARRRRTRRRRGRGRRAP